MIPTYNPREDYLEEALRSVLEQDPGPERMQIEVVDDCSPDKDVKKMVEALAGKRIEVSKTPKNMGLAGCWNTCIERGRGEWVHILHQDDYVLPGFYQKLELAAARHPEVSLLATRSFFVDEHSIIWRMTDRLMKLENGGHAVEDFFYGAPVQCAGVAVRRSFYEAQGGFLSELTYTLDCEMWVRAISSSGGLVLPEILSCYRLFGSGGQTGRLNRSAENFRDMAQLDEFFAGRFTTFDRHKAAVRLCNLMMEKFEYYQEKGDMEAARTIKNYWQQNTPAKLRLRWFVKKFIRSLVPSPA
jgi:glycosyltransferase involved in cell wall biosynthesis